MTALIISADDYAQSPGIDAAILALIAQGRLTAASCLTLSPRWPEAASLLTAEVRSRADIGLHLDFTQYSQPRHALPVLIARSYCRNLSAQVIRQNINGQLDRFEQALGTAPDYIDGHQHVHQLPQIRDELLHIITQRYLGRLPWLRISRPPFADGPKAVILNMLGANALSRTAHNMGLRCSDTLLGVYGFDDGAENYRHQLEAWFKAARTAPGNVLMCHPATQTNAPDAGTQDHIHSARLNEYQVLASPDFARLLAEYEIQPMRGNASIL